MSAREKNKHRSRHRTHAIKPASLTHKSLEKSAPVPADAAAAPAAANDAAAGKKAATPAK